MNCSFLQKFLLTGAHGGIQTDKGMVFAIALSITIISDSFEYVSFTLEVRERESYDGQAALGCRA